MKKILIPVVLVAVLAVVVGWQATSASFNSILTSRVSVMAAKLNFGLDGDKSGDLDLDLGEVEPGDSGTVDITVNNVGTIPGNLCVTKESFSPNIEVQTTDTCGETVDPGGFVLYEIKWTLPLTAHNTGLGGDFQFSYSFLFENGFKITRQVVLKGKLFDPTDTPTMTSTDAATQTLTVTETSTDILLLPSETATGSSDPIIDPALPTATPVPTASETPLPTATITLLPTATPVPTASETLEPTATEIPLLTATPVPTASDTLLPAATETLEATETPVPAFTDTPVIPTEVPTEITVDTPTLEDP